MCESNTVALCNSNGNDCPVRNDTTRSGPGRSTLRTQSCVCVCVCVCELAFKKSVWNPYMIGSCSYTTPQRTVRLNSPVNMCPGFWSCCSGTLMCDTPDVPSRPPPPPPQALQSTLNLAFFCIYPRLDPILRLSPPISTNQQDDLKIIILKSSCWGLKIIILISPCWVAVDVSVCRNCEKLLDS
jgi:hypothetical protein